MVYPIYLLVLAFAPGLIWLFIFLLSDKHPEPKRMILKIFFLGMLFALPAIFIELLSAGLNVPFSGQIIRLPGLPDFLVWLGLPMILALVVNLFLGGALVEEGFKFLAVRLSIFKNPELDEPVDVILYMIISALGFATLENI